MNQCIPGTTYYHFAHPSEDYAAEFAKMRDMGLEAVRVAEIWPGWEVLEPRCGEFDFADLDHFVQQAHETGLKVIMGVGINNPPFWVFREIPDLRCRDVSGKVATRRVQSANHDNMEYRRIMERFIVTHVQHYANMPGISAWQFGNEMRYGANIVDNEATRVRFRAWLREKFHDDLDELNRRWATFYESWEEMYPYSSPAGPPTAGLPPLALASREYQCWSVEELNEWGTNLIRQYSDLPVFHNNFGYSAPHGSHWRMARPGDWVVQDIYPATSPNPQIYASFLLDCGASIARSLDKPFWIGETNVGQYGTYHRNRPNRRQSECLSMEMLACGIEGLLYFRHRPPKYEQPHKFNGSAAAFRRDGSELHYAETIRNVRRVVDALADYLPAKPVTPQVGVYYCEESMQLGQIAEYLDIQSPSVFGASSIWNRLGIPAHVMNTDTLLSEDLSKLKVIHLPVTYLIPRAAGEKLAEFVRNGGVLISEARPGYVDELGWVYEQQPGAGLQEVFGAKEDLFWNDEIIHATIQLTGDEIPLQLPLLCQTYREVTGQPFAFDAESNVVGVQNTFGQGKAWLFGVAPSLLFPVGTSQTEPTGGKYDSTGSRESADETQKANILRIFKAVAADADVTSPLAVETSSTHLSTRFLQSEKGLLAFYANHGPHTTLHLPKETRTLLRSENHGIDATPLTPPLDLPPYSWTIVVKG